MLRLVEYLERFLVCYWRYLETVFHPVVVFSPACWPRMVLSRRNAFCCLAFLMVEVAQR